MGVCASCGENAAAPNSVSPQQQLDVFATFDSLLWVPMSDFETGLLSSWLIQLSELIDGFQEFAAKHDTGFDKDGVQFRQILADICGLVREANDANASELEELVDMAAETLNEAVSFAIDLREHRQLKSFAHADDTTLLKDSMNEMWRHDIALQEMKERTRTSRRQPSSPPPPTAGPWTDTTPPHPHSSRLSRFRDDVAIPATDDTPIAQQLYQARCEITTKRISSPVLAQISSGSSCLAVLCNVQYEELRYPALQYYRLNEDADSTYAKGVTIFTELSGKVAYHLTTDEDRKLMFVADAARIKSFRWDVDITIRANEDSDGAAVHTMRCERYAGAIAALPNGRLVRAGRGKAAIWNLDELETHEGGKRVGRGRFVEYGPWGEEIRGPWERSTGSHPSTTVAFENRRFYPWVFHYHPAGMLLAAETVSRSERYGSCVSLDIEHGGKAVVRYLGHAGDVIDFSSSTEDPNVFVTSCEDSYARIYDVRHPLPVITVETVRPGDVCPDTILTHPDGVPTLFTGSDRMQCIKVWDLRARAVVYDLSTGNNNVQSLAWDTERTTLYATTECDFHNFGRESPYRKADIPQWAQLNPDLPADPDEQYRWPRRAWHSED